MNEKIIAANPPPIRCTGYTKICGRCCHRFGEKPEMINKPRELEMVLCKKCETAEMSKWEKTLAGGLK